MGTIIPAGSYITDPKTHLPVCAIGVSTGHIALKKGQFDYLFN
jgi:hypothetical protein